VETIEGAGIEEVGRGRIREMDAQGIDVEALSINPQWYRAEREVVAQVVKIRTNGSPSSAGGTRTASSPLRRSRSSIRTWRCSSS